MKIAEAWSDEELAIQCQLGSEAAWSELVRRWNPRLAAFASRLSDGGSVTDDIMQSAWLRVVRSMATLKEPDRLGPWLFQIVRRVATDRLRRQYRQREELGGDAVEPTVEVDHSGVTREWIESGLRRLHARDREVVVLHYLQGISVEDVASICNIPSGTVRSRLHRSRKQLSQILMEEAK